MPLPDKRAVLRALLDQLQAEIAALTDAALSTAEGATHEEARPEDDKDTRAIEASYLARGQADRVAALRETLQAIQWMELPRLGEDDEIVSGALVTLEGDDGERTCFLAPAAGGAQLRVEGAAILVVTPASPLGQAVLGRCVGDVLEVPARGGFRELEIIAVA